jgi:O-antigen ligase/thioredoxin-like negative regulator of GroEL
MSYTSFLRWTLRIGLAAVFIIPFIIADGGVGYQSAPQGTFNLYIPVWGMFFPFITGKNFIFRILIEVLVGAYILLALREPKYRPRMSGVMWAVGAFTLWMAVATLVSVDPTKSFWSNFERMEGYLSVLHFFAYFVIAGAVLTAENWWNRLFQVSIASSAVMGAYGLLQLAHLIPISSQSGTRIDGTFGNAIYLAVFMLINIFLTLFMLVRQRQSTKAQVFYGIALVLEVAALYLTETRGALLGLVGGLIVAALYIVWKGRAHEWKSLRRISLWGLGVIAVLVIAFFALRSTPMIKNSSTLSRLASISLNDTTTRARLFYIWPMAVKGFSESPKTIAAGWGQENFNFVFNKYYTPQMYNQEQWFDRAHNQFLDWLIAGGLPALLLYLSFFVLAVWVIWKSELAVPEQALLFGLLAAYAFNNLTVFDDVMSSAYFFLLLAFVHSLSKKQPPRWLVFSRPAGDKMVAVIAPVVAVAVVLVVWVVNVPGMARAQNVITALSTQVAVPNGSGGFTAGRKDPKQTLQEFQNSLSSSVWPGTELGRQEVVEQFLQYASSIAASTAVDPSVKQDTFNAVQQAATSLMQQRSHDARLELFDGAFLDTYGQYQPAQQILAQALADSPKKQQIMFEVGVSYLNASNTKDAVTVLKAAFEEEPAFSDARILYASSLYYAGNKTEADALLMQGFTTVLVDDARLVQVYTNTKQFDRVVGIWQLRLQKDPNNVQNHLGLASAYFTAGNKAGAIAELERSAQLSPELASQIQAVIKQIKDGTLKP